ncbi:hypothetical protein MKZ38_008416 [Zalerion maritima]|uniref:Uncharacterized protein n=1 Tax=Zalerion maritima TaxID=339359 RepID=A0AAD5WNL7_9PEZI|nr:hypothetical protein MKZ38_008416 [Zalerion maritima]
MSNNPFLVHDTKDLERYGGINTRGNSSKNNPFTPSPPPRLTQHQSRPKLSTPPPPHGPTALDPGSPIVGWGCPEAKSAPSAAGGGGGAGAGGCKFSSSECNNKLWKLLTFRTMRWTYQTELGEGLCPYSIWTGNADIKTRNPAHGPKQGVVLKRADIMKYCRTQVNHDWTFPYGYTIWVRDSSHGNKPKWVGKIYLYFDDPTHSSFNNVLDSMLDGRVVPRVTILKFTPTFEEDWKVLSILDWETLADGRVAAVARDFRD